MLHSVSLFITFIPFFVFIYLGFYALFLDRNSSVNRVFLLLCVSFSSWSIAYTFMHMADTVRELWFWNSMGAVGWCTFAAFFLHFVLLLAVKNPVIRNKWFVIILYIPSAVFLVKEITGNLTVKYFVLQEFGWREEHPFGSIWFWSYIGFTIAYIVTGIVVLFYWRFHSTVQRDKKQAGIIAISTAISMILVILVDVVLPLFFEFQLFPLAPVIVLLWATGAWYSIVRYRLLSVTPEFFTDEIISNMADIMLLVDADGIIIKANTQFINLAGVDNGSLTGLPMENYFDCSGELEQQFKKIKEGSITTAEVPRAMIINKVEHVPASLSLFSFQDKSGDVSGILIIGHDLTDRYHLAMAEVERRLTQQALEESEESFRQITDNMMDLVAIVDREGVFKYVSPSYRSELGYYRNDLMEQDAFAIIHQDDREKAFAMFIKGIADKTPGRMEMRIRHADGNNLWYDCHANIVFDKYSEVERAVVISRNISDRKKSEEALRQSEMRYRTILESIEDGYFEASIEGSIMFYNDSFMKMLGYSRMELDGMNYRQLMDESNARKVYEVFNGLYKNRTATTAFDWELHSKNGDKKTVEASVSLIMDFGEIPTGFRGIMRDITGRKKIENKLRESEERYRTITENSSDVICEIDRNAQYVYISPNVESKLGYSRDDIIGRSIFDFCYPDDLALLREVWEKRIDQVTFRFIHGDGTLRWLDNTSRYFLDSDNEYRIVAISRDVTDRKKNEEERWKHEVHLRLQQMALADLAKKDELYHGDLKASFRIICETAGNNMGLERVGIWLYSAGDTELFCHNLYCKSEDTHTNGLRLQREQYKEFFDALEGSRFIDADDVSSDQRTQTIYEEYFKKNGVTSVMNFPFRLGGETVGIMFFEHVGDIRVWAGEEKNFAASLSDFASLAMESYNRKIAEEALRVSEEALRQRNETIEKDLRHAQIIQRALLPGNVPELEWIAVDYRNYSLDAVGGDYFSFTTLREGGLGVFIGDVSGHGVSAALFLSLLKSTADRICRMFGQQPKDFITRLNEDLIVNMPHYFITGIYGFFNYDVDTGKHSFTFSKGGHPNPILYKASTGEVSLLECKGTILGKFEDAEYYEEKLFLEKGDRIFLYTDGLPETRNDNKNIYGFSNVPALIKESHRHSLSDTLDTVFDKLNIFKGSAEIDDDIVLIGIEML
ncbi:MAG TPA: PAS domain S-box protein [Spirochaetota bacterium]|nr:PAS domain S-box protein [Spirochaetota bacterium]